MKCIRDAFLGAVLLMCGVPALAEDVLDGDYRGLEDATGARIVIEPDPGGYRGTFYDPNGRSQDFEADRAEDAAEAVLDMDGRTVLMRMAPLPFGAEVALIPFDAQGQLITANGRLLTFVRRDIDLPEAPENYVEPPRAPGARLAAGSFLASYEFWDPTGVRNGYLALPERFRTLMRLFPTIQLDVIWKLCLAPGADDALAMALRGQGVACPEVLGAMAAAQRDGRFDDFKEDVTEEKQVLAVSVRCADNYVMSKETCDRAASRMSKAAVSLETAATVLRRFQ